MISALSRRTAAVVVLSGSLLVGASLTPAVATPAQEAVYLANMEKVWDTQDAKIQKTTCRAYRMAPKTLIAASVANAWKDPASRKALSRAAWGRVITDYLAWACSGPGTTPR